MLVRSRPWLVVLMWACLGYGVWAEGKVWALVIGVDEYVHSSIPKLRYAVADAKLFAQALQTTLKVPQEQVFLLTSDSVDEGSEPKAVNVAYRLSWLSKTVKAEDTLIFYFAGHGLTLEGEPFLLTEEADSRSALTLKVSALHQGEVVQALRQARVANCWLVLDTCRNSPTGKEEIRLSPEASRTVTSADVGVTQTASMFACKVGERSWEWDEKSHGCFTYFLVEGLRQGGADSAGIVTLQGLSQYVSDQVSLATKTLGSAQNPWMLYGGPGQEKWVLATVAPRKASGDDSQTSLNVAKLEAMQARLDQETARRVAAEQKARLEEAKRLELEQRLALLELQVNGTAANTSATSAASPVAYLEGGADEAAVRREVALLSQENGALRKKLQKLEQRVALVGSPELSRAWNSAAAREKSGQARLARGGLSPADSLALQQGLRQAYADKLEVLEKAQGSPKLVDSEARKLNKELQIQRQRMVVTKTRLVAAEVASLEASQRQLEAETREKLVSLESLVDSPKMAEVALIEDQVRQLRRQRTEVVTELSRLQEKKLAQLREVEIQEDRLKALRGTP